ncbi:MAG: leucine-rich repeat domain-containing protein, partial [Candidatus Lokiarchaeota archaeon]
MLPYFIQRTKFIFPRKMKVVKEFQVSALLSLKLELGRWDEQGNETDYDEESYKVRIYVDNKPFRICTYLLILNPQKDEKFKEIESIDDAKSILKRDLEIKVTPAELSISPEEEFWAHCSNIQAWYEHEYDTRLLDSLLAFPLLKKLMKEGDPKARGNYSTEVMKRYAKGNKTIKQMLHYEGYFKYVPFEEQVSILEDPDDYDAIISLREAIGEDFKIGEFQMDDGKVTTLYLKNYKHLESLPTEIGMLGNLRKLEIALPNLTMLPGSIGNLKSLEELYITAPNLPSIPRSIGNLKVLKELYVKSSQLVSLPEELGDIQNLISLTLENCKRFENLPESL